MEPVELARIVRPSSCPGQSLVRQIYRDLRAALLAGTIESGAALPSSRKAAAAIGVSRNTLNDAYDLLRAEGLIAIQRNKRPVVAPLSQVGLRQAPASQPTARRGGRTVSDWALDPRAKAFVGGSGLMAPGRPDNSLFPHEAWGRALRRASRNRSVTDGAFDAFPNHAPLRGLLAEQLRRDRGMKVDPENILITSSTQASLSLAVHVRTQPGDTAMFEDPGYLGARAVFVGAGLKLQPLHIAAEGASLPQDKADHAPRLIYLTPSNQFPLGRRLSPNQRMAFIDLACASGAMIVEDDYDSEFLWRGREIAAMHALDGGQNVIYLGTTSKTMMLGMRLGWMVVPPDLVRAFAQAQRNLGASASIHVQAAMAEFLNSGEYRAHLRKITRAYAERRQLLAAALKQRFGGKIGVNLPDGGLQMAILFQAQQDEEVTLAALAQAGFSAGRLSAYCLEAQMRGLVVGIADATAERIDGFCTALQNCW